MNKNQAAQLLSESGWLSRQPESFRAELIARSRLRQFEPGHIVCHAGDAAQGIFGLAQGCIELSLPSGRLATVIHTGFWFGEAPTLASIPAPLSVRIVHRSFLLALPIVEFEVMALNSGHCRCFAKLAVEHLTEVLGFLDDLSQQTPRARVAGRLMALAQSRGEAGQNMLRISQDELASMCAVSHQTVNKILQEFATTGALGLHYRTIRLLNVEALRAATQDDASAITFAEKPIMFSAPNAQDPSNTGASTTRHE